MNSMVINSKSRACLALIGAAVLLSGGGLAMAQTVSPQQDAGAVMNQNIRDYYIQRVSPWTTRPITEEDVTGQPPLDGPLIQGNMRDINGQIVPIPGVPAPTFNLP